MFAIPVLPATRLVKGAAGTLSHQFTDSDGEPAAPPAGTLAVAVTRSNGDTVTTGAIAGSDAEPRTVTVGVAEMLQTDWLTATWTLDGDTIAVDLVEVVGGTLGNLAQLRNTDANLNGVEDDELLDKRRVVEDMSLAILKRGVFERFCVERIPATRTGVLFLSFSDIIEVAWVRTSYYGTTTTLTSDEVAGFVPYESTVSHPTYVWPCAGDIEVGYRFGMRACPRDLLMALRKSVRHALNEFDTGIPAYAASMQTADGFSIGLAGPGNDDWATGDINIDRVVNRYRYEPAVMA